MGSYPPLGSHIPILGSSSRLWVLHTPVGVSPDRVYVERRRCLNRMGSGGLMGGPTGITLLPGGSGKARLWFQAQVTPFGQALVYLISSAVLVAALCLLLVLPSTGQACSTVTFFPPPRVRVLTHVLSTPKLGIHLLAMAFSACSMLQTFSRWHRCPFFLSSR